jgi:protein-disulfide isomerase
MMQSLLRGVVAAVLVFGFAACGGDAPPAAAETTVVATARPAGGVGADTVGMRNGYRLGASDAPIVVVEFSDFGCPYCARFALATLPELRQHYIDAGLVRWRYVPVSFGFPGGALMGAAAECAGRMGGEEGFWEAHHILYRHQTALRGADALPRLLAAFREAGTDPDALERCLQDPGTAEALEANNRLAQEWLVRGTPTFLVNGVPMSGAMPTEYFRKVLDTALDPSGL